MKRIDTINARANMFGVGKSGFHDNADLPGQDATYVSPEWFNTVQEELCNLLELRGITLDPASKRQLYDLLTTQADLEALADEIEANFIRKSQIVDNLTTNDADKVASARTVKELQDKKLEATDLKDASTTQKGVVKLNNTLTSDAEDEAATAKQVKILNDQAFGIGQGWHNVTSSRNLGTKYRNTRNKPITISLYTNSAATSTKVLSLKIDEEEIARCDTNGNDDSTITQIISPNEDYEVSATGLVLGTSLFWKEKY